MEFQAFAGRQEYFRITWEVSSQGEDASMEKAIILTGRQAKNGQSTSLQCDGGSKYQSL